jgi:hypothetical protein
LTTSHRLDGFQCGEPSLDEWLMRRALANQASSASRTFVVLDDGGRVRGYYALAAGAVAHELATSKVRRNMPDPAPVMVLGKTPSSERSPSRTMPAYGRCWSMRCMSARSGFTSTTGFSLRRRMP